MSIAVLTSSRADFGIYLPGLRELEKIGLNFKVVCFGMHLEKRFGETKSEVLACNYPVEFLPPTLLPDDSQVGISLSMAKTTEAMANYLNKNCSNIDAIVVLGDRFEMYAAAQAAIPFNIPIVHIHGGEQTEGAIDNKFRHALTKISDLHFVTCEKHAERVKRMGAPRSLVHDIGSLSLAGLLEEELYSSKDFEETFSINLEKPTVLVTFHPETVYSGDYSSQVGEMLKALDSIDYQILITLGNADTNGESVREEILDFCSGKNKFKLVDHLGKKGYLSAMKLCSFLVGNSSSGIIEAASFNKYVINLGDRQKGRECSKNVLHCDLDKRKILEAVKIVESKGAVDIENIYYKESAAKEFARILSEWEPKVETGFYEQ